MALLTMVMTLGAGLIPFHAPENEVTPGEGGNGIRFGRHGTALTSVPLNLTKGGGLGGTIEIWVRPARVWTNGSIFASYDFSSNRVFKLQQDYPDLVLSLGDHKAGNDPQILRIVNVFREKQPFISVTFDGQATSVYIDSRLALKSSDFKLSRGDLSCGLFLPMLLFATRVGQVK